MKHCIDWRQSARAALVIGALASFAWACGDDGGDDEPIAGTSASGTGGSGGSTAGTGGGGGGSGGSGGSTAGTGGGGGTGGSAPMPIDCNGMQCTPIMTPIQTLPPCCDASMGNACGAIIDMAGTCIARGQMGTPSDECDDEMSVLGMAVEGCCRPDGMCGLQSGTLMGCIERSKYPLGFLMGMPTTPLASMACSGDADGGI